MLLLALLASAAAAPQAPPMQANGSARIMRAARVTADEWHRLPPSRRREIIIRDDQGRLLRLRLIEHE